MSFLSGWLSSKKPSEVFPIITLGKEDLQVKVHEENLQELLGSLQLKRMKVVVIGISGIEGSGKSSLMDIIKLYMQDKIVHSQEAGIASRTWKFLAGESEWLTFDKLQKSGGLHFTGLERDETIKGIYAYKHPFICKTPGDEKVAVIILDSNGICNSEFHMDKTIFILMSLLCSQYIINVKTHCQDTEVAVLSALENCFVRANAKCDVKLLFPNASVIVRDSTASDEELGYANSNVVKEVVQGSEQAAKILNAHFRGVNWYLFPASCKGDDDETKSKATIETLLSGKEVKEQLINFCDNFCNPEKLATKTLFTHEMTCHQLQRYINRICRLFQRDTKTSLKSLRAAFPNPEAIHEGIVMAMCDEGIQSLRMDYKLYVLVVQGEDRNIALEDKLEEVKAIVLRKTIAYLEKFKLAGCPEVIEYYKERAIKDLQVLHAEAKAHFMKTENEKLQNERKKTDKEMDTITKENQTLKENLNKEKEQRLELEKKLEVITKTLSDEKLENLKLQKELDETMQLLEQMRSANVGQK